MMRFDSPGGYDRYASEYAFYRIFDAYNEHISNELTQEGIAADVTQALLFSDGAYIHDMAFADKPGGIPKSREEIRDDVRELMSRIPGAAEWVESSFDTMWQRGNGAFWAITLGDAVDGFRGTPTQVESNVLVVSPFDERFKNREMMLGGGVRPMFVDVNAFEHAAQIEGDMESSLFDPSDYRLRECTVWDTNPRSFRDRPDALERHVVGVGVLSANDLFGVTEFKPFMSDDEYAAISDSVRGAYAELLSPGYDFRDLGRVAGMPVIDGVVRKATVENGATQEEVTAERGRAMRTFFNNVRTAARRGRAILGAIDDRGYQYSVVPSRHAGQIEARVGDTGANVRIFDAPRNINMVGRVYDSRSRTTSYAELVFSNGYGRQLTNTQGFQQNNDASIAQSFDIDDAVFVNGVLYALGENVELDPSMTDSVMFQPLVESLRRGPNSPLRPTNPTASTDIQSSFERSFFGRGSQRRDTLLHLVSSDEFIDAVDVTGLRMLARAYSDMRTDDALRSRELSDDNVISGWPSDSNVTHQFVGAVRREYFRNLHAVERLSHAAPDRVPADGRIMPSIVEGSTLSQVLQSFASPDGRDANGVLVRDARHRVSIEESLAQYGRVLDGEIERYNGNSRLMGAYNGGRTFAPGDEAKNKNKISPTFRTQNGLSGRVSMGYVNTRHAARRFADDVPARVDWKMKSEFEASDARRFENDASDVRAMGFIYGAVSEARDNFAALIDIEGLEQMARERVEEALATGEAPDATELPDELSLSSVSPIVDELRHAYWTVLVDGYWAEEQAPMERPKFRLRESVPGVHENTVRSLLLPTNDVSFEAQRSRYAYTEWGGRVMGIDDEESYGSLGRGMRVERLVQDHFEKVMDDVIGAVVDEHGNLVHYAENEDGQYVRTGADSSTMTWASRGDGEVVAVGDRSVAEISIEMDEAGQDAEAWRESLPSGGSEPSDSVWFDPVNVVEFMGGSSNGREELMSACRALKTSEGGHYGNVRRDFVRVGGSRISDFAYTDEDIDFDITVGDNGIAGAETPTSEFAQLIEQMNAGEWNVGNGRDTSIVRPANWNQLTPQQRTLRLNMGQARAYVEEMNRMRDGFSSGIVTMTRDRRGRIVQHSPSARFVDGLLQFGNGRSAVGTSTSDMDVAAENGDVTIYRWSDVMESAESFDATAEQRHRADVLRMIRDAVRSSAADVSVDEDGNPDIAIDANGVVEYKASLRLPSGAHGAEFIGHIGQFFMPDEYGLYPTKFAGSSNYALVAGREAYYLDEHRHDGSALERERFITLDEHVFRDATRQIRRDIITHKVGAGGTVGTTVSLNSSYSHFLASDRLDLNHAEIAQSLGMSDELHRAIVAGHQGKRRHIEEDLANDTSVRSHTRRIRELTGPGRSYREAVDDRSKSNFGRTGFRSTSVVHPDERQVKDAFHVGGGFRQMDTTHAVSGVRYVRDEGTGSERAIPSSIEGDASVLAKLDIFKYSEFDSFYRRQKTLSDVTHCFNVTEPVGYAACPIGGGNQDDACRVSLEFALSHFVLDENGEPRPLSVHDKLSDMHGNKWIISQIIDADESGRPSREDFIKTSYRDDEIGEATCRIDEANYKRELAVWEFFHNNPDLSVAGPPDCGVSRFNAGSFREAMDNNPTTLHCNDGKDVEGGIGWLRVIVQDKTAEEKTTFDNGRKLGWQTSSNVSSMGMDLFMSNVFGANAQGHSRMLESMRAAFGYDLGDDGSVYNHLVKSPSDDHVFSLANDTHSEDNLTDRGMLSKKAAARRFSSWLGATGGYLEVPFELKWPDVMFTHKDATVIYEGDTLPKVENENIWHMPIMAASERRGSEAIDGEYKSHDVTGRYEVIYGAIVGYEHEYDCILRDVAKSLGMYSKDEGFLKTFDDVRERLDAIDWKNDRSAFVDCVMDVYTERGGSNVSKVRSSVLSSYDAHEANAEKFVDRAQRCFTQLADDVAKRNFTEKTNLSKRHILSHKIPGEAVTAVWGSDPGLHLDEVAVGRQVADTLGLKDGDTAFIWRDPVLSENCIRAMKVCVSDTIYGANVNPELAPMINGDFDGDQIGIYKPYSEELAKLGASRMAVALELVDFRHVDKDGKHPVTIGGGPDLKRACYHNPEFKKRYDEICDEARAVFDRFCTGEGKSAANRFDSPYLEAMEPVLRKMDVFVHEAHAHEVGLSYEALQFGDGAKHIESVYTVCVEPGAKGSVSKLVDYGVYCGVHSPDSDTIKLNEAGEIKFDELACAKHTLHTYADDMSVQNATALKTAATGEMGKFMQGLLMAFPDDPDLACTLAFGYYQKALDWKHDGYEAMAEYDFIPTSKNILYHGVRYFYDGDNPTLDGFERDELQGEAGVTKSEWVDMMAAANEALGIKTISRDYLERAADLLAASSDDGMVHGTSMRATKVCSPAMRLAFEENAEALMQAAAKGATSFYRATVELYGKAAQSDYEPRGVRAAVEANGATFGLAEPYVAKSVVSRVVENETPVVDSVQHEQISEVVNEVVREQHAGIADVVQNTVAPSVETAEAVQVEEVFDGKEIVPDEVTDPSEFEKVVSEPVNEIVVEEVPDTEVCVGDAPSTDAYEFVGDDNPRATLMMSAMRAYRDATPIAFSEVERLGADLGERGHDDAGE